MSYVVEEALQYLICKAESVFVYVSLFLVHGNIFQCVASLPTKDGDRRGVGFLDEFNRLV